MYISKLVMRNKLASNGSSDCRGWGMALIIRLGMNQIIPRTKWYIMWSCALYMATSRNWNSNMNTQECSTRVKAPDIRNSKILSNPCNWKDEGISLKTQGGDKPDTRRNKDIRLLECKKYIQIATLNVRTIRTPDKLYEMEKKFNGWNLHILGITDHKMS